MVGPDTGELGRGVRVEGTVDLSGSCATLAQEPAGVVWPYGTTWDEGDRAVILPSGTRVHDGDPIVGTRSVLAMDSVAIHTAMSFCGWKIAGSVGWLQGADDSTSQ